MLKFYRVQALTVLKHCTKFEIKTLYGSLDIPYYVSLGRYGPESVIHPVVGVVGPLKSEFLRTLVC